MAAGDEAVGLAAELFLVKVEPAEGVRDQSERLVQPFGEAEDGRVDQVVAAARSAEAPSAPAQARRSSRTRWRRRRSR